MLVKIGEREYQLPLKYKHCVSLIADDLNEPLFYMSSVPFDHAEAIGNFIVSALNEYQGWKVIERDGLPEKVNEFYLWQYSNDTGRHVVGWFDHYQNFVTEWDGTRHHVNGFVAWREISPYIPEGK